MSRVILHQLPDTLSPEETIFKVRQNPSLIYNVLGYGHQNIHQDAVIICFESSLVIPHVEAQTYDEAFQFIQNENDKADFFVYDGFTFLSMNLSEFKSLSSAEQQDFVNMFIDSLSLQTYEVKELAVYSLASLAAMTVIEQSNIIDPGMSDVGYFNDRENDVHEITSITFEAVATDRELLFTSIDDNEWIPNIEFELPESIVFDIDVQADPSVLEISDGGDLEEAGSILDDDTEPNFYNEDENPFDENLDTDPYDNFDLL